MSQKAAFLFTFFCCLFFFSTAQKTAGPVMLKTGAVSIAPNDAALVVNKINSSLEQSGQPALVLLQFSQVPDAATRSRLGQLGIQLLEFIPGNAFTALVHKKTSWKQLQQTGSIQGIAAPKAMQKTAPELWPQAFGPVNKMGRIPVWVRLHNHISEAEAQKILQAFGQPRRVFAEQQVYELQVIALQIQALAANSQVAYVQPQPPPAQPLLQDSRTSSGAALLQADAAQGGRGLNGAGVVIGIGDDGDVQTHLDFSGRLINRAAAPIGSHATHVHGIAGGAGIIDERYIGFAPRATMISQVFEGIFTNAGRYIADHGMVVTNNSYGNVLNCNNNGVYDFYSAYLDEQAFTYPTLLHVFAAGNSGGNTCPPYEAGFGTVLGSYQSAKNVLTVGNVDDLGQIFSSSSRGPVKDGRLKPEIMATGTGVTASWPTNSYGNSTGTSMAAPAVTGGAALLYQRYRQLYNNRNPENGLIKALLCNGATDMGIPGPDFRHGFGYMNLSRSLSMLESGRFIIDSVAHGAKKEHRISLPAGTAELKVMLYWNDPSPAQISRQALVHDLDLQVNKGSTQFLPLVLDTAASALNSPAVAGIDRINNIEQVVIKNAGEGEYTLQVSGSSVATRSSQSYVLVYDVIPAALQILAPIGGDRFDTSETIRIQWEAAGFEGQTLSLQLSTDDGANWSTVASNLTAATHFYRLKLPSGIQSTQARIRLMAQNGTVAASNTFCIGTVPKSFSATAACEGYLVTRWRKIAGATGYEVMQLSNNEWVAVAQTTDTSFTLKGLSKDVAYAVSVRAVFEGGIKGRRCAALVRTPSGGNCAGAVSDGDLKLDALESPVTARLFTANAASARTQVSVRIKNLDNQRISSGFNVMYSMDEGQSWHTETVSAAINAQGVYTHHFSPFANMAQPGSYSFILVVKSRGADTNPENDTLRTTVRVLPNPRVDLTSPLIEDFEQVPAITVQQGQIAPEGLERFDFIPASAQGRLRSFVNTGFSYNGRRGLTLDVDRERSTTLTNYLQATYNLSAYEAASNEIRFDFFWAAHSQDTNSIGKVWVRGSETDPWLPVLDLKVKEGAAGVFQQSPSLRLSHTLAEAGQQFSATTQIRWEQTGKSPATLPDYAGGYTIDQLRLYRVRNDVQLLAISKPVGGCGMGNAEPVEIVVANGTGNALSSIPVRFSVNGEGTVTEMIPALGANDTIRYTFAKKVDLSKAGQYNLQVTLALRDDELPQNDTLTLVVHSQDLVQQFPYFQNFEGTNDGWYAAGQNSSWALGTPASAKISRAASGSKAWKTNLAGTYNSREVSYLYSPCLQIGGLKFPTLSFQVAKDFEACTDPCDSVWVEYSTDGISWQKLNGNGTGWYARDASWHSVDDTNWHVATVALPTGIDVVRLRFAFYSDASLESEGIALDDIHVYDNTLGIYQGPSVTTPVTQPLGAENNWTHFTENSKLLASVQPKTGTPATISLRTYLHQGEARSNNDQYYHNRSLVLESNGTTDSVRVRFYFTESETQSLLRASGCNNCVAPHSVIDLGITVFRAAGNNQGQLNGDLTDNRLGFWSYIPPQNALLVPFDAGYYLEFDAMPGSEFWLNAGGLGRDELLPVKFLLLNAYKISDREAQLQWTVAGEAGITRYEVEVAVGTDAFNAGAFIKLGQVAATGNDGILQYQFTDTEQPKWGNRYYRIKSIDVDGNITYSPIALLQYPINAEWKLFPNPSDGLFFLYYELPAGEVATLQLTDAVGRLLKTFKVQGTGQANRVQVDLSDASFVPGMYLLHSDKNGLVFRLLKQRP